jgi:hypothetical protein
MLLKKERRISFEDVVLHIGAGDVVNIFVRYRNALLLKAYRTKRLLLVYCINSLRGAWLSLPLSKTLSEL